MKKLLTCILCIGFAVLGYAQEPAASAPAPAEEDVVYLKDGGVLRGEIVGTTKKTGRIQLRDGSIFVYKRANIKMASKEPVSETNAKEDSLKMVKIAKQQIESEAQKRKQEEEILALQKMISTNRKDGAKKEEEEDKEGGNFRMYSTLEMIGGIGVERLPAIDSTTPATDNKQRIVGMHYAIGGRTDYFFIGLNVGLHQIYRNLSPKAAAARDTLPTTLLALPVGLDMRVEFVPQGGLSPYLGISGAYALSLTEGIKDYMVINPSFGLRFGRGKVSSLISGGYQLNIDGNDITHYVTVRLGLVF